MLRHTGRLSQAQHLASVLATYQQAQPGSRPLGAALSPASPSRVDAKGSGNVRKSPKSPAMSSEERALWTHSLDEYLGQQSPDAMATVKSLDKIWTVRSDRSSWLLED